MLHSTSTDIKLINKPRSPPQNTGISYFYGTIGFLMRIYILRLKAKMIRYLSHKHFGLDKLLQDEKNTEKTFYL